MVSGTANVVHVDFEDRAKAQSRNPKRRARSPHPGVVLLKPKGTHGWRACFIDPDLEKENYVSFRTDVTTSEQRRAWAIQKSKELIRRKMDLDNGAVRATGRSLKAAFDDYQEHHKQLRPRTLYVARVVATKFITYAARNGISTCDKVNRAFLLKFRAKLINEEKRRAKPGGKRGEYIGTGEKRGHDAVNHDLISIRAMLGYLCDLDQFPKLNTDDLRRGLKKLPKLEKRIQFLTGIEIRELLEAALDHDAETFHVTRAEHSGEGPAGTTPRYEVDPVVRTTEGVS